MGKSVKNGAAIGSGGRLTRARARKAVKVLIAGGTKTEAVAAAGYGSPRSHLDALNNPTIQDELHRFRAAMLKRNPEIYEKVAQRLDEGLDAQETKLFAHKGVVQDERNLISYSERREAASLIARIFGELNQREGDTQMPAMNINQLFLIVKSAREARGLPLHE